MDHSLTVSPTELLATLGTSRAPRLIDVCLPEDAAVDPRRLPAAQPVPHRTVADWAAQAGDVGPVVVVCQRGRKLSHGAAAQLRSLAFDACALEGGNVGWCSAGLPHLSRGAGNQMPQSWVLSAQMSPRDLAMAWLIRRWCTATATFLCVPPDMIDAVAERFDAAALPGAASARDLCALVGLRAAPVLVAFLSDALDTGAPWVSLLAALPQLHPRPEAQIAAALPLVDAAWVAHQSRQLKVVQ